MKNSYDIKKKEKKKTSEFNKKITKFSFVYIKENFKIFSNQKILIFCN